MSVLEIWGAEYQENDCLLIKPESRDLLEAICERERCLMQVGSSLRVLRSPVFLLVCVCVCKFMTAGACVVPMLCARVTIMWKSLYLRVCLCTCARLSMCSGCCSFVHGSMHMHSSCPPPVFACSRSVPCVGPCSLWALLAAACLRTAGVSRLKLAKMLSQIYMLDYRPACAGLSSTNP